MTDLTLVVGVGGGGGDGGSTDDGYGEDGYYGYQGRHLFMMGTAGGGAAATVGAMDTVTIAMVCRELF